MLLDGRTMLIRSDCSLSCLPLWLDRIICYRHAVYACMDDRTSGITLVRPGILLRGMEDPHGSCWAGLRAAFDYSTSHGILIRGDWQR